jgi:DNA-binding transcriptional MerR regulator
MNRAGFGGALRDGGPPTLAGLFDPAEITFLDAGDEVVPLGGVRRTVFASSPMVTPSSLISTAGHAPQTPQFSTTFQLAVRFYERQGRYRTYDREAIDVLRFINRAKALGFSLEEVREILMVRRSGTAPCARVTKMIGRHLAAVDQRIAELSVLRRQLRRLRLSPAREQHPRAICPIIESDR